LNGIQEVVGSIPIGSTSSGQSCLRNTVNILRDLGAAQMASERNPG
jgi:hypothetical protein